MDIRQRQVLGTDGEETGRKSIGQWVGIIFLLLFSGAISFMFANLSWSIFSGARELEQWSTAIVSNKTVLVFVELIGIGALTFYVGGKASSRRKRWLAYSCGILLVLLLGGVLMQEMPFLYLIK